MSCRRQGVQSRRTGNYEYLAEAEPGRLVGRSLAPERTHCLATLPKDYGLAWATARTPSIPHCSGSAPQGVIGSWHKTGKRCKQSSQWEMMFPKLQDSLLPTADNGATAVRRSDCCLAGVAGVQGIGKFQFIATPDPFLQRRRHLSMLVYEPVLRAADLGNSADQSPQKTEADAAPDL